MLEATLDDEVLLDGKPVFIHELTAADWQLINERYGSAENLVRALRRGNFSATWFGIWVILRNSITGLTEEEAGELIPLAGFPSGCVCGLLARRSGLAAPGDFDDVPDHT
jgi:hypothetical protein